MRKVIVMLLVLLFAVVLVGCGEKTLNPEDQKIVLITDKGDITDKSFNQGAYEGVKAYAEANDIEYGYLRPTEATNEQYIAAIEQAIADGATIIVTPGYLFEPAINAVQGDYPNVYFILLDGSPANVDGGTIEDNVYSVFYAEEQSGFLAGYAAVMDGYRSLGFMGGLAVPAVQRFGHGFVQGAAKAADELGLANDAVTIQYLYTGDFKATPEVQAAAATMFNGGVEVIFACGGAVGQSVMAAAATAGAKVIGVDVDQSGDSDTVITSAMKNLAGSVQQALEALFEAGNWDEEFGGKSVVLDASRQGVQLPIANSDFATFTTADYEELLGKLVDGTYTVSNVIGAFGDDGTAAEQFETAKVKVQVILFEG
ncbi:MAG: BMP family ABC transporter substrate-binding protein [Acholeplasmataceae bacterium]|jgi:basic membrane protein A|nr:BMP family ABC transporter substrate-binding protein [Acholeplasmataceae bacterium]